MRGEYWVIAETLVPGAESITTELGVFYSNDAAERHLTIVKSAKNWKKPRIELRESPIGE